LLTLAAHALASASCASRCGTKRSLMGASQASCGGQQKQCRRGYSWLRRGKYL